jgi:outer membrane receptor for ferrienterochelin and colicin
MLHRTLILFATFSLALSAFGSTIFGAARGVVHDPQHRPIQSAAVTLQSRSADWSRTMHTNASGEFSFIAVPLGDYSITASAPSFASSVQNIAVSSGTEPVLHFQLSPGSATVVVNVLGAPQQLPTDSSTPTTMLNRLDIEGTPGASRTNSLAMITDFIPGAYVTHDQLHVRGGHQTSWLIDGVPIPNTNIASNLGPQLDPKDIDYLEVSRGSYSAELGDRTYGAFNVMPRTGFERNNQAELVLSAGNFYQTNDQFSLGSHTERFAYYASVNGNRSDLGIQTPVSQVVHDRDNGFGGFGSLIYNLDPSNQLRFITSLRRDYYQIPYDPNPDDLENQQYPSSGLRDGDHESDALMDFSWVHTFNPRTLLTVSPFYHYNRANYDGSPDDTPVATTQYRGSTYAGGQVTLDVKLPRNNLQVGTYDFYQSDNEFFAAIFNNSSGNAPFTSSERPTGSLAAFFVDDKLKVAPWLTLSAGARPTHFSGGTTESAISPRLGAALTLPHLNWTLRGFYGHFYQAPPLITASGALVQFANNNSLGFIPLHGERDEEFQFGIAIPYRGWVLDADTFRTRVNNFFDHNNIGESNLFFPITIQSALIRAWELTLRSPRIAHRAQFHLAYSNQIAEGGGVVTGGLTNTGAPIQICGPGVPLCPLDHDQRNTLNLGGDVILPWQIHVATNVYYGSGFTNGTPGAPYPGAYLPSHTTLDLSASRKLNERCTLSVTALNVANRRVLLDNSTTFGGFHWNSPRELFAELRYRFHY